MTKFLEDLKMRGQVLTVHQKHIINEYKALIAANNNCNTNTAAASIAGDVNCNTNYFPAGDDWVMKGLT